MNIWNTHIYVTGSGISATSDCKMWATHLSLSRPPSAFPPTHPLTHPPTALILTHPQISAPAPLVTFTFSNRQRTHWDTVTTVLTTPSKSIPWRRKPAQTATECKLQTKLKKKELTKQEPSDQVCRDGRRRRRRSTRWGEQGSSNSLLP